MIDDSRMDRLTNGVNEDAGKTSEAMRPQTGFGDQTAQFVGQSEGKTQTGKPAPRLESRPAAMVAVVLALPVATFLFARCWSVPLYLANDDVGMELLLRGVGVTSRPTAYVQFMHVWLGEALVWLYAQVRGLSWYQVFMNGTLVTTGLTVAWTGVRRGLNWNRLVLVCIYCLAFLLTFFVQPNFSISAAIATQAAMILWLGELAEGRILAGARLWLFIGLILVGGMIRIDACLSQLVVAVPIGLWLGFGARYSAPHTLPSTAEASEEQSAPMTGAMAFQSAAFSFQWMRTLMLPLVIAGGIAGFLRVSQSYVYASTPGWEQFEEFNRLRAQFTDYQAAPFSQESRAVYERAGWTENDYDMLMSWFFENPALYNIEKFKAILSQAARPAVEAGTQLGRLLGQVQNDAGMRLMVVGAFICVFFVDRRGLATITVVASTVATAMITLVMLLHRLPPWFSGPLLAFVPGAALVVSSPASGTVKILRHSSWWTVLRSQPRKTALQAIAIGACAWTLIGALSNWRQESAMISQARTTFVANLVEIQRRPKRIYVTWGGVFPFELILDNEDFRTISKLRLIALGCLSQTPINNERLHELGIEDLYRAMFQDPRVQVFCHPDNGAHFMHYVHEHYGKRLEGRLVEAKPLGKYPIFNATEGRYDLLNRLFWLQEFREGR
jgi:hypothetical protein